MEIVSEYLLEKPPHFICLDPESNLVFVSNNKSDSIFIIDTSSHSIETIEIESPRNLVYSPNFKRLYVISGNAGIRKRGTGKKISVIDMTSQKVVSEIGNDEGFGGISINNNTKKIYVTRPKKKQVLKIDEETQEIEKTLNVKSKYKQIIVNENTDELILAGTFTMGHHTIAVFSEQTNSAKKIFKKSHNDPMDYFSIKYYPKHNIILANLQDRSKHGTERIHIIDYDNPTYRDKINVIGVLDAFDLDETRGFIYYCYASVPFGPGNCDVARTTLSDRKTDVFSFFNKVSPRKSMINEKSGNLFLIYREKKKYTLSELSI